MKLTEHLRSFLEVIGIVKPRLAAPVLKATKPRAKRNPAATCKTTAQPIKVKVSRKPAVNHAAESIKAELLNRVADALGHAPSEYDPNVAKVTIAVNGSLFTIRNTVEALSEFQSRLEKLQTKIKVPGVPRAARKLSATPRY